MRIADTCPSAVRPDAAKMHQRNEKTGLSYRKDELLRQLKWLMAMRAGFAALLLGSTIMVQTGRHFHPLDPPFSFFYGLIGTVFLLSAGYVLILKNTAAKRRLALVQIGLDTAIVTIFVFLTGGYNSIFTYLYLIVVIYASVLLYRRGNLIIALLCGLQYTLLAVLEFSGFLVPYGNEGGLAMQGVSLATVAFKSLMMASACFAVALLGSRLSEQARRNRKELAAIKEHVKRVEKMAAVGEMAAGLAHELKNPLAAMTGSIQMLKEEAGRDPGQQRLMHIVLREIDRLSSLVSDFLLFARPPAGRNQALDLQQVLSESIQLFEKDPVCAGRVRIVRNLIPDVWIEMDVSHLRQVFWNLLRNAAEAIPGRGRIEVQMQRPEKEIAVVSIRDNGCGIAPAHLATVFDPFFTTKPKGTGLGLSVVHRILESHGVRIDVESAQGEGTRFVLHFRKIPALSVKCLKAA